MGNDIEEKYEELLEQWGVASDLIAEQDKFAEKIEVKEAGIVTLQRYSTELEHKILSKFLSSVGVGECSLAARSFLLHGGALRDLSDNRITFELSEDEYYRRDCDGNNDTVYVDTIDELRRWAGQNDSDENLFAICNEIETIQQKMDAKIEELKPESTPAPSV